MRKIAQYLKENLENVYDTVVVEYDIFSTCIDSNYIQAIMIFKILETSKITFSKFI
jgi:hypothetical protein